MTVGTDLRPKLAIRSVVAATNEDAYVVRSKLREGADQRLKVLLTRAPANVQHPILGREPRLPCRFASGCFDRSKDLEIDTIGQSPHLLGRRALLGKERLDAAADRQELVRIRKRSGTAIWIGIVYRHDVAHAVNLIAAGKVARRETVCAHDVDAEFADPLRQLFGSRWHDLHAIHMFGNRFVRRQAIDLGEGTGWVEVLG